MARCPRKKSLMRSRNTASIRRSPRRGRSRSSLVKSTSRSKAREQQWREKKGEPPLPAIEVKVPDIGDFKDVPVIEVLVKPGDSVKKDDSLITLESDKATMQLPPASSGTVNDIRV